MDEYSCGSALGKSYGFRERQASRETRQAILDIDRVRTRDPENTKHRKSELDIETELKLIIGRGM